MQRPVHGLRKCGRRWHWQDLQGSGPSRRSLPYAAEMGCRAGRIRTWVILTVSDERREKEFYRVSPPAPSLSSHVRAQRPSCCKRQPQSPKENGCDRYGQSDPKIIPKADVDIG